MVPTLRHGDRVVARRLAENPPDDGAVRAGDVVLARFRDVPDLLVVKRAVRRSHDGWWVASDNPFAGGDSGSHGVADVTAVVRWRVARGRPSRVRRSDVDAG